MEFNHAVHRCKGDLRVTALGKQGSVPPEITVLFSCGDKVQLRPPPDSLGAPIPWPDPDLPADFTQYCQVVIPHEELASWPGPNISFTLDTPQGLGFEDVPQGPRAEVAVAASECASVIFDWVDYGRCQLGVLKRSAGLRISALVLEGFEPRVVSIRSKHGLDVQLAPRDTSDEGPVPSDGTSDRPDFQQYSHESVDAAELESHPERFKVIVTVEGAGLVSEVRQPTANPGIAVASSGDVVVIIDWNLYEAQ